MRSRPQAGPEAPAAAAARPRARCDLEASIRAWEAQRGGEGDRECASSIARWCFLVWRLGASSSSGVSDIHASQATQLAADAGVGPSNGVFVRLPARLQDVLHLPQHRIPLLFVNRVQAFQPTEACVCAHRRQHHIAQKNGADALLTLTS